MMCCFMQHAEVLPYGGTKILCSVLNHHEHGEIASLFYECAIHNKVPGPNSMLLPIRANGWIEEENIIDLAGSASPLEIASHVIWPPEHNPFTFRTNLIGRAYSASAEPKATHMSVGDFDIIVANQASLIPEMLKLVSIERRPQLNAAVLEFMEREYATDGFKLILVCWSGENINARLGLWYKPELDVEGYHRIPAFDYHGPQDKLAFGTNVRVNHRLMYSHPEMENGASVSWSGVKSHVLPFLPKKVAGIKRTGLEPNGDYGVKLVPSVGGNLIDAHNVVRLSATGVLPRMAPKPETLRAR